MNGQPTYWLLEPDMRAQELLSSVLEARGWAPVTINHTEIVEAVGAFVRARGRLGQPFCLGPIPEGLFKINLDLDLPNEFALDYLPTPEGQIILVSSKFRSALGLDDNAVQYYPVELVRGQEAFAAADYKALFPLRQERLLDMEASVYTTYAETYATKLPPLAKFDTIRSLKKLVMQRDLDPNLGLVFDRYYTPLLFISNHAAQRIADADCSGYELRNPEEYSSF